MIRSVVSPLLTAVLLLGFATPAVAADESVEVVSVELVGGPGARFVIDDRTYAGPMVFTMFGDGIGVTERASIEQYLQGIAEMPFAWNEQALAAQAVAARTYLARTLLGGRRGNGADHDYDICATSTCQVYRGVELVEGASGDRWKEAVASTAGEVVLDDGKPIEAVYTSMVGSRSRANQDVWASDPVPYLQPVDSPEIGIAPYAEWTVQVSGSQFIQILKSDGYDVGGALIELRIDDPPEGEGRATITVESADGTDDLLAPALKGAFNRQGGDLYPGELPVTLPDGTVLPQPLPAYTSDIVHNDEESGPIDRLLPIIDRIERDIVVIRGEGWGHGVGMSQWGARILAGQGLTYDRILGHYYGGLTPEIAPQVVPESVIVGLAWGETVVPVSISESVELFVNGVPYGTIGGGDWLVASSKAGVDLVPLDAAEWLTPISDRQWPR